MSAWGRTKRLKMSALGRTKRLKIIIYFHKQSYYQKTFNASS
jgi:hypothetical protein